MTLYRVTRQRPYRGHEPLTVFEANLDPATEGRALARGDIEILDRSTPSLQPGSYRIPYGWLTTGKEGFNDG